MKDTSLAILALLGLFVALPVLLLWLRDRVRDRRHRKTPAQIEIEASAYRDRLLNPNQSSVEADIGGFLPDSLVALYGDRATVLSRSIEIRSPRRGSSEPGEWVQEFLPLDIESQKYTCDLVEAGWGKGFCFAGDGLGNFYWVPVTATRQPDAPVFFACHDPWGNQQIADGLEEFLSWPRVSRARR